MKEFVVGLLALLVFVVVAGAYFLLLPFIMIVAFFLRIIFVIVLGIFAIWLLGKLIVMLFEEMKKKK